MVSKYKKQMNESVISSHDKDKLEEILIDVLHNFLDADMTGIKEFGKSIQSALHGYVEVAGEGSKDNLKDAQAKANRFVGALANEIGKARVI